MKLSFAALALGSNLGDRFRNIELALRLLERLPDHSSDSNLDKHGSLTVIDTSFMYETAPMYVIDQPSFLNCACLIETTLSAPDLLRHLKEIEAAVGRVPSVRFGPRAVDLDIITFGSDEIDTRSKNDRETLDNLEGQLVIPHPRMAEREFVLRPLNDFMPDWIHPKLQVSIRTLLDQAMQSRTAEEPAMSKVMPFPSSGHLDDSHYGLNVPSTSTYWTFPSSPSSGPHTRKTYLMATLNVTPDSFSDGSMNNDILSAVSYAASSVASGADIIDIGGYSTRPRAHFVSTEEEIQRVVPVIEAIRNSSGKLKNVLISIDTFRWEVARAAVLAGANCVNDVYALSGPGYPPSSESKQHFDRMREVVRELAVPIIMMHSRGDAGENKDYSAFAQGNSSSSGQVIDGVRMELGQKVDKAVRGKGGLRRWLVVVDPGVGFSKTLEGNLEILRRASEITTDVSSPYDDPLRPLAPYAPRRNLLAGFPQLIGASRKSFLGVLLSQRSQPVHPTATDDTHLGRETLPKERGYATAAAISCAIQQGAAIVRVHDVQEMADVIKVASALWG